MERHQAQYCFAPKRDVAQRWELIMACGRHPYHDQADCLACISNQNWLKKLAMHRRAAMFRREARVRAKNTDLAPGRIYSGLLFGIMPTRLTRTMTDAMLRRALQKKGPNGGGET
jgi:hypothetical protein